MAGDLQAVLKDCKGLHTGVDSLRVKYDVNTGATYLQACANVVVDRAGRISRRKGALKKSATVFLDIFSSGVDCVGHTGGALYRIARDYSLTGIRDGLSVNAKMHFAATPEGIFYTNGIERGRIATGGLSYSWVKGAAEYSPLKSLTMYGPPDRISHIHYHNGRMFCAVGKVVYYSDYRSYGNFYYERDMLQHMHDVIGFASAGKTLFVFTTKTVFAYVGDSMKDAVEVAASNIPLIEGTVAYNDSIVPEMNTLPMWLTKNGIHIGLQDGQVRSLTEDRLVLADCIGRGKAVCHKGQYIAILSR